MALQDWFALTLSLSPRRKRPELLSRLAPLNPPASGARDVPARSGSECNRRLGEGSGTSRLSEPLRPGTGRAPKEGSWAGSAQSQRREKPLNGGRFAGLRKSLPPHESGAPVSDPARWGLVYRKPRRVGDRCSVQRHTERTSAEKSFPGGEGWGEGERLIPLNSYSLVGCRLSS